MPRWDRTIAACLTALALASAVVAAAPPAQPPSGGAGPDLAQRVQAARLVRELGSNNFAQRERATRELVQMGVAAREALLDARKDDDAEVRARARGVLSTIDEDDFSTRLTEFAADIDGRQHRTMPGWEKFSAQVGNSPRARGLFVEMQRSEPELLAAYATGNNYDAIGQSLGARCQALYDETTMRLSHRESLFNIGSYATLLFVGGDLAVPVAEQHGTIIDDWLASRAFWREVRIGEWAGTLRTMLGSWIVKDCVTTSTPQNLIYAATFGLRERGLELATNILARDARYMNTPKLTNNYFFSLMLIGRMGGPEHIALVEQYLADAAPCGVAPLDMNTRQVELQLRDVALAVLIRLTYQQPEGYAPPVKRNQYAIFEVALLAFAEPAQREAAIARWKQWRAEHPPTE